MKEPGLTKAMLIARRPAVIVSGLLAAVETLPAGYYGRYLATLDPAVAVLSGGLSFAGTFATYLLAVEVSSRLRWLKVPSAVGIGVWTVFLQIVYFGIYREFGTLPTVSVIDFVRQTPEYAWALFRDRLDVLSIGVAVAVVVGLSRAIQWGFDAPLNAGRSVLVGLSMAVLASYCYAQPPFMTFSQQAAALVVKSSHGPGLVNAAWTPDRDRASPARAKHPVNVLVFRLEEIAAQATTLERTDLPTTPLLKAMLDAHPSEAFVGHHHFSNSTATDVSVLSIYTGLSPAAELDAHRHVPIMWDYFAAAGYDTSLFLPFHLEWGDFRRRFNARPDELHLNKVVDAGNSGLPIAYDNSINDTDVAGLALDYQRKRNWAEPFLQIVSLKMPHAIGEGARVNKLNYGAWEGEPADLRDYYNGIRHDDILMQEFMGEIPDAVRERTIVVILSDHGTRLFPRTHGAEELHRLDNYHLETTKVPFVVYVPQGAQAIIPGDKIRALRENLATRTTSNIDMVPTVIGLTGLQPPSRRINHSRLLVGRDLTEDVASTEAIIQLNTGALRRWDREHFGLVLDNGRYHYLFSMGRELLYDMQHDALESKDLAGTDAHSEAISRAHSIIAEVPELLRIQRKYRRGGERELAEVAPAATKVNVLTTKAAPAEVVRIEPSRDGTMQSVAEYTAPATTASTTVRTELAVRIHSGNGRLEWRLRSGDEINHIAHSDALSAKDVHRFSFRWGTPSGKEHPLSITLLGVAEGPEPFSLSVEAAAAHVEAVEMKRPVEVLALTSGVGASHSVGVYSLERFVEHQCLKQAAAPGCPNGYLVWGPYVKGAKGSDVRLRYDIETGRAGANIWFDLSERAGRSRIAQSRIYHLDERGSHSFEFAARLAGDVEALEGRLNAFAGASLDGYEIAIKHAELSLLQASGD